MKMYQRMLVPLDGSNLAEAVLEYAKEFAGRLDLNVTLLYVCEPHEHKLARIRQYYMEHTAEIVSQQSHEVQRKTTAGPAVKELDIHGELAFGHPAEEILRHVEQNNIDLILMSTHGRSGISRWALGSVADKILRASSVPVCLVRAAVPEDAPRNRWPIKTIVVPLDGSELAESVLPHVEALAKQRGSEQADIILLAICEPMFLPSYYPPDMPLNWDDHLARCKRTNKEYLDKVERRLKKTGLNVRSEVQSGSPASEIINYTRNNPLSLVVMATHGRSGPSRLLLGSVAQKVLLGISNPLFLVRPG
jgi:nucleotide-binding universal stress UspA family protein